MRLTHDDIFQFGFNSLCHLRLFASPDLYIAVACALDDAPGPSPINAAEDLHRDIAATFGVDPSRFRLVVFFPASDAEQPETWKEITVGGSSAEFADSDRAGIEAIVGARIHPLGPGPYKISDVVDGDHPAARLAVPDEPEHDWHRFLSVVDIADLPWAHKPFNCAHRREWGVMRAEMPSGPEFDAAVGARFFLSLTPSQLAACPYHHADWRAIADASVRLLELLPADADFATVHKLAARLCPQQPEQDWLVSLFTDSIHFHDPSESIGGGQHRACALRCSGAARTVAQVSACADRSRFGRFIDARHRAVGELALTPLDGDRPENPGRPA